MGMERSSARGEGVVTARGMVIINQPVTSASHVCIPQQRYAVDTPRNQNTRPRKGKVKSQLYDKKSHKDVSQDLEILEIIKAGASVDNIASSHVGMLNVVA